MQQLDFYIINLLTGTRIELPFIPAESLSEEVSAEFEASAVRGRSTSGGGYSSTGPRPITFSVTLHDDFCRDGILRTTNRMKALCYPTYSSHVNPPICFVRLGRHIRFRAICRSVSLSWQLPLREGRFIVAEVSFTFDIVEPPQNAFSMERGSI